MRGCSNKEYALRICNKHYFERRRERVRLAGTPIASVMEQTEFLRSALVGLNEAMTGVEDLELTTITVTVPTFMLPDLP